MLAVTLALLYRNRIRLRPIAAQERIAHRVVAIWIEVRRKVVECPRLVVEVVLDHAVRVACAARVQAHLQILVVDFDVMKRKLAISKHADVARLRPRVANLHIPQFDVVFHRNEQCLLGLQVLVVAGELRIRQPMPRLVLRLRQILAHRLPRDRPVIARVVISQINVVPRSIHRHTVRTKARDPSVLGILVERISARIVRDHRAQIFHTQVIRPRHRHVDAINYILPVFIIKMAVTHQVLRKKRSYELR